MSSELVPPTVLLLIAFIGALIVLRMDSRRKALRTRVVNVTSRRGQADTEHQERQGIRFAAHNRSRVVSALIKLSRVPVDLEQANIVPVWLVCAAGAAAGAATFFISRLYFSVPVAACEAVTTAALLIRGFFGWETQRYTRLLIRQLPDAIELLSSSVSAGLPATEGLRIVSREIASPTREQFQRVMLEIGLGMPADMALQNLHSRTGVTEYAILSATLGVQARSGGRLVETVQTLAETVRQRLAIVARGHALAAESKLSAYVIAAMPVAGGALMAVIKPGYLNPLFYDPRGTKILMIAIGTLLSGMLIMRRMIRGALRE